MHNKKHSEETKKKISEILNSEEIKRKMSLAMLGNKNGRGNKGKKLSEETIRKIRESQKGNKNLLGFKFSEESRNKMSITHKEREPKGNKSKTWKGGKFTSGRGYVEVFKPEHPYCKTNHYVPEHRLIMEEFLSRYLLPKERVHHINEITTDNRIENLMLCENLAEHRKIHRELKK